jgi:hypothetical protein
MYNIEWWNCDECFIQFMVTFDPKGIVPNPSPRLKKIRFMSYVIFVVNNFVIGGVERERDL